MMKQRNNDKSLALLADQYGMDPLALLEAYGNESVVPAICTSLDCEEYSAELESDCDGGFCNYCGESSMVSCMVLAGVI